MTDKQKDALEMRANGVSTKVIAELEGVSRQAVQLRLQGASDAMSANDITHAVAIAIVTGKISVRL